MFAVAVLIGIYSYGIFALGVLGILTSANISAFTLSWVVITAIYFHNKLNFRLPKTDRITKLLILILGIQCLINLIGALGPELGFDALWYHLTLPKIWLTRQVIDFIPGPVFKYSVMPKLTETLYAAGLSAGGAIIPKLIHYGFGLMSLIVTYKLARKFLSVKYSLLSVLILTSNLVFAWQSTTAYVDLTRTFFESLALLLFIKDKYTASAITLGLAVSSKLIALASLPIYILLLIFSKKSVQEITKYVLLTFLIPLPWFIFAYISTGNPFYPVFSDILGPHQISLNLLDFWTLFTKNADPLSPIYIITAPLVLLINFKKQSRGVQLIFLYSLLSLLAWFITPRTGGGRFILPYLPALSVTTALVIKNLKDQPLHKFIVGLILFIAFTSLVYRLFANYKFLPVLLGTQTTSDFLSDHLNFDFGDYYDTDNFIGSRISHSDPVLVSGINNLFYLPSENFYHDSEKTDLSYKYLLQRSPDSQLLIDKSWKLIHENPKTQTKIFEKI